MGSNAATPLRIGILGAARVAPAALIAPAKATGLATVVAVAARDGVRARAFADEHAVATAYGSYEALLADPAIDAVYNALPPSRHADLTIAALNAGKHVLCEKPFAMNQAQAKAMVEAGQAAGLIVMEAFHYRYHPLFARVLDLLAKGEIGAVRRVAAVFSASIPDVDGELRYRADLGGGALMDLGTYCLHWIRTVVGAEPLGAQAQSVMSASGVDVSTHAILTFPGGQIGEMMCDMAGPVRATLEITGLDGVLKVVNPLAPQMGHMLEVRRDGDEPRRETVIRDSTYDCQLTAFVDAVRGHAPPLTGGADAVAQMAAIDAIKAAAAGSGRDIR